ncbi:MAG TPA: ABC transporter ATP-binding protein [Lentisphaeria bacterium]|nr:ABC transporter ATP-binding protein [Lentisphaeria bacterium]
MDKAVHPPCGGCCTRLSGFGVSIGSNTILKDINLHVHCGELTAIIGPNGAGKTTLLRAMIGEIPHRGELHFVHSDGSSFGKPRIGYVPQKLDIDKTSPVSVLDLFSSLNSKFPLWLGHVPADRRSSIEMLKMVEAEEYIDMKLSQLSCGQMQRVMLALALSPTPDLLLLDEPIAGVDRTGIEVFYRIVSRMRHEFDLSIFLISHDISDVANFADRMLLLNRSIVCDGTPAHVLSSPETKQIFGVDFSSAGAGSKNEKPFVERHNCPTCGNCIGHDSDNPFDGFDKLTTSKLRAGRSQRTDGRRQQ